MREIMFRGKQRRNGQWIYGNYIGLDDDNTFICPRHEEASSLSCSDLVRLSMECVKPETIGQYTGMTDKNGKKIFEGDIVDMTGEWWDAAGPAGHTSPICAVEYDPTTGGFDPFANYDCDCGVYIEPTGCNVIGNIHDNPELLKE